METFATRAEAEEWMDAEVDDSCIDGYRFAFLDSRAELGEYRRMKANGCCGFFDAIIVVGGRRARIGCNYGH
jgi:hypothetical protein